MQKVKLNYFISYLLKVILLSFLLLLNTLPTSDSAPADEELSTASELTMNSTPLPPIGANKQQQQQKQLVKFEFGTETPPKLGTPQSTITKQSKQHRLMHRKSSDKENIPTANNWLTTSENWLNSGRDNKAQTPAGIWRYTPFIRSQPSASTSTASVGSHHGRQRQPLGELSPAEVKQRGNRHLQQQSVSQEPNLEEPHQFMVAQNALKRLRPGATILLGEKLPKFPQPAIMIPRRKGPTQLEYLYRIASPETTFAWKTSAARMKVESADQDKDEKREE